MEEDVEEEDLEKLENQENPENLENQENAVWEVKKNVLNTVAEKQREEDLEDIKLFYLYNI